MQGRDKGNADEAEEKHECTRRQQTDGASPQSSGRAIERQPLLLLRCMLSSFLLSRVPCVLCPEFMLLPAATASSLFTQGRECGIQAKRRE
jgi:hypothetical protein